MDAVKDKSDNETAEDMYIQQLTPDELKAMNIAKEHLDTSFNIEKSVGYCKYAAEKSK